MTQPVHGSGAGVGPLRQILEFNPTRIKQADVARPSREFVIWFTARSGSSHLAELLTSAQVGDVREWLNPAFMGSQAEFFGATTFVDYFARIRSICPRGVFGQKITVGFYEAFSREVRLEDHFDLAGRSIVLFRHDLVDQAVSLSLANRRKVFHQTGDAVRVPDVDYDMTDILRCAEALAAEEQRLHVLLQRLRATPRFISYEQFTGASAQETVAAAARLVGVTPALSRMQSRHRKLEDPQHRGHYQRFVEHQAEFCASLRAARQWLQEAAAAAPLLPTQADPLPSSR